MTFSLPAIWNFAASFYKKPAPSRPAKIWCFTPYPYRVGLATTINALVLVLALIIATFIVIGVITLIFFIVAIAIFLGTIAGVVGALAVGARGSWIGIIIALAISAAVAPPIWKFGIGTWDAGKEFAENMHYATDALFFLKNNWLAILGIIIFPAVAVFSIAGLTVGVNYLARWVESGFSKYHGIRYPCPECSQKTEPAKYYCPNPSCRLTHSVPLLPNQYGIFSHECEVCSTSMPTMLLLGRNRKLQHECPHCGTALHPDALGTDKHIVFVGGKDSGKTCLRMQATRQLLEKGGHIPEPDQKNEFDTTKQMMQKGDPPEKTREVNIYRAFQVILKKKPVPWHLHFYDLAGEKYEAAQDAATYRFYSTLDGVVFVFDPFSLPDFRSRHPLPLGFRAADLDPLDLARNLTQVLEKFRRKEGSKKIAFNLLFVKTDTGYLDGVVFPGMDHAQQNGVLRQFLINELGQGAFVHHIEHSFPVINYLHTSALGRTPDMSDRRPFEPDNFEKTFQKVYASVGVKT
jgi:hypothetical protein